MSHYTCSTCAQVRIDQNKHVWYKVKCNKISLIASIPSRTLQATTFRTVPSKNRNSNTVKDFDKKKINVKFT